MNTNINSPEFWEQVKKEFEPLKQNYLCYASKTFDVAWKNNNEKIKEFARDFLLENKEWGFFESLNSYLFWHGLEWPFTYKGYYDVRLAFLDYMINRTRHEHGTIQNAG